MLTRPATPVARARRLDDLKLILESRRAEVLHELQDKIRSVRSDGIADRDVVDEAESSELDVQGDIGFALIQLKAQTLKEIDTALRRIEVGDYGDCSECRGEIAAARLRALPFAVRCRECEEAREATDRRERSLWHRDRTATLFPELPS